MSTSSSRWGMWASALVLLSTGACGDERQDLVRKTIGPSGGLISSHDDVLTLVFQPGALQRDYEIEIFPSDLPPLIFGPAYRVKPDVELDVDVEVTYRRVLPSNTDGVSVAAIRLDDYSEEMGYWQSLPRLSIDEASGSVLASDSQLSLYYGMLESGGGSSSVGTSGASDTDPTNPTNPSDPTNPTNPTDPSATGTSDATDTDPTDPSATDTDPTAGGCGDGTQEVGELCFMSQDYPMGGSPIDLVLGDFDNNGDLDVATANDDGSFSVRLGDGGGGLGAEINTAVGMGVTSIGSGDFDQATGDDLVVALGNANQFVLLQSLGNGMFNANPIGLSGTDAAEVLIADGTGDNVPDILIANAGSNNVSYFPFMGGLGAEGLYLTNVVAAPVGMAYTQVNTDTDMVADVLVFGGGNYAALPGSGAGFGDAPIGGALGTDLRKAIGGELGGSNAGDAAVADFSEGGIYVLIGSDPAGEFTSQDFYPTGNGAIDVASGDVNDDGDIDLVVANSGDDTVTVLLKTGGTSWDDATDFDVAGGPSGIGAGDLNGDGLDDIVVSGQTGNAITVLVSDP